MKVTLTIMHSPDRIALLPSKQKLTTLLITSSTSGIAQRYQRSPPSTEATASDEPFPSR
jgi:hypothetical protein